MSFENLNNYMIKEYPGIIGHPFDALGFDPSTPFSVKDSTENLLISVDILDSLGINYRVVFGTLLGLYRDGGLIPHDTDVDIALPLNMVGSFIKALPLLEGKGFTVIRYKERGIVSLGRKGNYVDFYFFCLNKPGVYDCLAYYYLDEKDFDCGTTVKFQDRLFPTVASPEKYFAANYGHDWRIPIQGLHAHPSNALRKG